ncbi:hypothetical protein HETIRDRAFT_420100 [Heterobasidion irregulare TC 32-1]|uniref:Uncharacterized protein n=1 Tax=Heterobasidion irregulare (strain TC 32-1) TaxID=747525 RepID=W4K0M4_HETIT|nr:uncharacterized protein HETIRDRAFT_420100 [Heterobasidion irregulare TC 32-1]ETW78875.1 hypothetical protein HETIRDRAFT_420100 [Heterobasidion irregulare TC 32-1]
MVYIEPIDCQLYTTSDGTSSQTSQLNDREEQVRACIVKRICQTVGACTRYVLRSSSNEKLLMMFHDAPICASLWVCLRVVPMPMVLNDAISDMLEYSGWLACKFDAAASAMAASNGASTSAFNQSFTTASDGSSSPALLPSLATCSSWHLLAFVPRLMAVPRMTLQSSPLLFPVLHAQVAHLPEQVLWISFMTHRLEDLISLRKDRLTP